MSGSASAPEAETIIRQTDTINRLMGQSSSRIEQVQRSLDGAYAAQQRFANAQNTINAALERGRISQERAGQLLDLARQRYQTTGQAIQNLSVANDNAARTGRNFGSVIGQAGFQVQDFFVQVQGGTSALTAFSQQGSQLLGVFGPAGAIAGAILAIGSLAAGLLLARNNAEAFRLSEQSLGEVYARNRELIRDLTQETRNLGAARAQVGIVENQTQLGQARLAQDRLERERETIQRENELARRAGGALDQGLILQNRQRLDELNQRAQRAGQIADRIQQDLDRLTELRRQYVTGENMPVPPSQASEPADSGGGGGGARSARAESRELEQLRRMRDQVIASIGEQEAANVRLAQSIRLVNEVERAGAISAAEAAQARQAATDRYNEQMRRLLDKGELDAEQTKRVLGLTQELGATMGEAFGALVREGKSFEDVLKNLERQLLRLGDKYLLQPLFDQLAQLATSSFGAGGGSGGGGFLGNILSSLAGGGGAFVGEIGGAASSGLAKGAEAIIGAAVLHDGGVAGSDSVPTRPMPASVFLDARRYHSGGVAGGMPFASDELPAVLRRGELVLTERQQKAAAQMGGLTVVNNISAPSVGEFRSSGAQISADLARATSRAASRNR